MQKLWPGQIRTGVCTHNTHTYTELEYIVTPVSRTQQAGSQTKIFVFNHQMNEAKLPYYEMKNLAPKAVPQLIFHIALLKPTVFDLISAHFPISAQYDNV